MLHARSPFVPCVVSLILFTISTPTAFGQSESGGATMVGIVRDQTSAVVPGVTVTVRIERVELAVGETETLSLTLTPGAVTESIVVTASSPLDRVGTATSTSIS